MIVPGGEKVSVSESFLAESKIGRETIILKSPFLCPFWLIHFDALGLISPYKASKMLGR